MFYFADFVVTLADTTGGSAFCKENDTFYYRFMRRIRTLFLFKLLYLADAKICIHNCLFSNFHFQIATQPLQYENYITLSGDTGFINRFACSVSVCFSPIYRKIRTLTNSFKFRSTKKIQHTLQYIEKEILEIAIFKKCLLYISGH